MSTILPGPPRPPEPHRRRRLTIAVIAFFAVLAVVVVAGGAAVLFTPRPAAPEPSSSPSPTAAQVEIGGVNGCLAGTNVTTVALLNAQRQAPHTQQGAIALSAAILAWMAQIPRIPAAEGTDAMKTLMSSNAAPDLLTQPRQAASATFPAGLKTGRVSYVNGRYLLASSSADEVRVSVGGSAIYNDVRADSDTWVMTLDLVWEGGMWKLKNNDPARDANTTLKSGTAFSGGC